MVGIYFTYKLGWEVGKGVWCEDVRVGCKDVEGGLSGRSTRRGEA
jgi:hypothetical protein